VYDELIGRPFANQYIERLLATDEVMTESPRLAAHFARQIHKEHDMSEQKIDTLDFDEFQAISDGFIERSSHAYGEMPASTFFALLFEKMAER
jgi:hypothetical protein